MIKLSNILCEGCWEGYKQVGMKTKNGKQVPNCVPESVNENIIDTIKKVIKAVKITPQMLQLAKSVNDGDIQAVKVGVNSILDKTNLSGKEKENKRNELYKVLAQKTKNKSMSVILNKMGSVNEAFTKGTVYGGSLKIDGKKVPVEVVLQGADNKKNAFIVKVLHIDKKYYSKIPKDGILHIPAKIFRTPGGGWYKVKVPKAF